MKKASLRNIKNYYLKILLWFEKHRHLSSIISTYLPQFLPPLTTNPKFRNPSSQFYESKFSQSGDICHGYLKNFR